MKKKHGALCFKKQAAADHSMGSFDRMNPFDRMVFIRSNGSSSSSSACHVIIRSNGSLFDRMKMIFFIFVALLSRSISLAFPITLDLDLGPEKRVMDAFLLF
ncbi:hypothetical protein CASFOL_018382 [Castilleja foliolosa]|uniref:Uncharacterized protein n=1 Tax=Castilleja foliolosa TaxID=1961234 RepID=A0ABD3D7Y3_9LAMI